MNGDENSTLAPPTEPTSKAQTDVPGATAYIAPANARDDDLIEAEWVEAAKHIMQTNAQDPYILSASMANLRKYYLHKRYGKELEQPNI